MCWFLRLHYPRDDSENEREKAARLGILIERVSDDSVREKLSNYQVRTRLILLSQEKQDAEASINTMINDLDSLKTIIGKEIRVLLK